MSAKAIREYDGKKLLAKGFKDLSFVSVGKSAQLSIAKGELMDSKLASLEKEHPWLSELQLVVKPDQLIKRRGKSGLILLNATWDKVKEWVKKIAGAEVDCSGVCGVINTFIIEPFLPHLQSQEYYVCIRSVNEGDEILLAVNGGVDVGNVDDHAKKLLVKPLEAFNAVLLHRLVDETFPKLPDTHKSGLKAVTEHLYRSFLDYHFTYLEINPIVQTDDGQIHLLDLAAKLDQTAEFLCSSLWGPLEFPAPFGREATLEEDYISELDAKTGASLKLTVLNKDGRIWTMVAGGGASVAFSDAIASHGFAHELANYGEYSGAPSETQTYEYSKTILDLMTRGDVNAQGKILFIGGGIANFTNVAATFKGIIRAIEEYHHELQRHHVVTYVRRAGPNYQEGLEMMRELAGRLSLPIHVYGPEMHITGIVPLALGKQSQHLTVDDDTGYSHSNASTTDLFTRYFTPVQGGRASPCGTGSPTKVSRPSTPVNLGFERLSMDDVSTSIMTKNTRAIVWGMYTLYYIRYIYCCIGSQRRSKECLTLTILAGEASPQWPPWSILSVVTMSSASIGAPRRSSSPSTPASNTLARLIRTLTGSLISLHADQSTKLAVM